MNKTIEIKIYSSPDCPYCYTVKDYLAQKEIEFEEIDLYENPEKRKEMEKISHQKNIPVLVINNEVIVGWNKEKIDELLKKYGFI
ncbi:MAG: glutaredoxin family protein [Minisyncoccia bacterium]